MEGEEANDVFDMQERASGNGTALARANAACGLETVTAAGSEASW